MLAPEVLAALKAFAGEARAAPTNLRDWGNDDWMSEVDITTGGKTEREAAELMEKALAATLVALAEKR